MITSKLLELFPGCASASSTSAQWIPWVFKDIRRRAEGRKLPDNFFETYRLYVSCYSSTDDIEYIAQYSTRECADDGDGTTAMSTCPSRSMRCAPWKRTAKSGLSWRKILYDNPARFYEYKIYKSKFQMFQPFKSFKPLKRMASRCGSP